MEHMFPTTRKWFVIYISDGYYLFLFASGRCFLFPRFISIFKFTFVSLSPFFTGGETINILFVLLCVDWALFYFLMKMKFQFRDCSEFVSTKMMTLALAFLRISKSRTYFFTIAKTFGEKWSQNGSKVENLCSLTKILITRANVENLPVHLKSLELQTRSTYL